MGMHTQYIDPVEEIHRSQDLGVRLWKDPRFRTGAIRFRAAHMEDWGEMEPVQEWADAHLLPDTGVVPSEAAFVWWLLEHSVETARAEFPHLDTTVANIEAGVNPALRPAVILPLEQWARPEWPSNRSEINRRIEAIRGEIDAGMRDHFGNFPVLRAFETPEPFWFRAFWSGGHPKAPDLHSPLRGFCRPSELSECIERGAPDGLYVYPGSVFPDGD